MTEMVIAKPIKSRGDLWFHRHNPTRARGDRCHHREKHGEGSRAVALERTTLGDIDQQLDEMRVDKPASMPIPIGYSQNSYQYEEWRFREEEEGIQVEAITHGLRERVRAIRLIACPGYFEDQVGVLEIDPEIGDLATALFIEDFERTALEGLTA